MKKDLANGNSCARVGSDSDTILRLMWLIDRWTVQVGSDLWFAGVKNRKYQDPSWYKYGAPGGKEDLQAVIRTLRRTFQSVPWTRVARTW